MEKLIEWRWQRAWKNKEDLEMEELIRIMGEIRPDIDFETAENLIDDDILDSFDIISIVSEVNDFFCIEINVNDLLPENFNTASALYELITRMMEE